MRIGFIVSHLGNTQLARQLIRSANGWLDGDRRRDVIVFTQNVVKPVEKPRFSTMNVSEAFGFDGAIIATDIHGASQLLNFPGPSRRLFYIWDLEWIRHQRFAYESMVDIYSNKNLEIIARSKSHADLIRRCWNRNDVVIARDFDMEALAAHGTRPKIL